MGFNHIYGMPHRNGQMSVDGIPGCCRLASFKKEGRWFEWFMLTSFLSFVPCDSAILTRADQTSCRPYPAVWPLECEVDSGGNSGVRLTVLVGHGWEAHRCQEVENLTAANRV